MSGHRPDAPGSGRWHMVAIVIVTVVTMVLGILVVFAPDRMGVPDFTPTQVATPATPVP